MKRLTGLDATFLYLETPTSHMHVAGLSIFDPADGDGRLVVRAGQGGLRRAAAPGAAVPPAARRGALSGSTTRCGSRTPTSTSTSTSATSRCPPPGGPTAARRARRPPVTHPARPQPPAVGGLGDRGPARTATSPLLSKVHHAAIDGASGNELTVALLDLTPELAESRAREAVGARPRPELDVELLGYAASLAGPPAVPRRSGAAARPRAMARVAAPPQPRAQRVAAARAVHARRARRSTRRSPPHRSFAYTSVSLPIVKAVKNAAATTVNDVVLALCAGALRR